ncbi:MAG: response regulator transcription factor, partial [Verrucomicrobiae bacterium]|nr:response regulator transcription factor [Verrucomicrobiae bacterium]
ADGVSGLRRATEEKPDLILLDLMMPKLDGYAVCQELRRLEIRSPILVLTARGRVEDRVRGLDLGADDYLVKPFSRDELLARVRALLRRRIEAEPSQAVLRFGDLLVDLPARRVIRDGGDVALAPKEFDALALLIRHAGRVVTREEFLDRVWGCTAFPTTRTVDRHIAGLRQKLEEDPARPRWIHTLHGVGYVWERRTLPETP